MAECRSLVEGLTPVTPEQQQAEEEFVYGAKARPTPITKPAPVRAETPPPEVKPGILPQLSNRVPITTRTRPEVASALKRASLERQLSGMAPFYVQEILEEALENWLRDNGYL